MLLKSVRNRVTFATAMTIAGALVYACVADDTYYPGDGEGPVSVLEAKCLTHNCTTGGIGGEACHAVIPGGGCGTKKCYRCDGAIVIDLCAQPSTETCDLLPGSENTVLCGDKRELLCTLNAAGTACVCPSTIPPTAPVDARCSIRKCGK